MRKLWVVLAMTVAFSVRAAVTNSLGQVITNAAGVWKSPLSERVNLAAGLAASDPTNAAFKAIQVRVMYRAGLSNEAAALKASLATNDLANLEQTLASDAGNAWEAVRLIKQQLAVATNNPSGCFVLALRLATIHQTGAVDGKVPVVNGQQVPVKAVAAQAIWPTVINVCATCQIPKTQLKSVEQMLARLKLAQASGDITSEELARAARGIYNGLPAIPEASDTLSKAKLLYDISKPRTGASLPARAAQGQASVNARGLGVAEFATARSEQGTIPTVGPSVPSADVGLFEGREVEALRLPAADLVERRMALVSAAPMPGSTFSRVLARDKSLEAQERWTRALKTAIEEIRQAEK